jgi:large subunit ribosomal protein L18
MSVDKNAKQLRRKRGIRAKISGTTERPRLSIFRSNAAIYAQIIDDSKGVTLVGASSKIKDIDSQGGTKSDKSKLVGKEIARRAQEKGITSVVFDRNGFRYHGRVKALAEGAREGGLQF